MRWARTRRLTGSVVLKGPHHDPIPGARRPPANEDEQVERARETARERSWSFETRDGDMRLLERLFLGLWEGDDDFIVVQPGQQIVASDDERVIDTAPAASQPG